METQHNRHIDEVTGHLETTKDLFEKNRLRRDQILNQKVSNLETLETKIEGLLSQNTQQRKDAEKRIKKMIEMRFDSIRQEIVNEYDQSGKTFEEFERELKKAVNELREGISFLSED